ncbi:MAG TPA: hypothetical protein VI548_08605 [Chitinophagaceae bacterium]|nr:hypothetical protein [Chitinophagaceae bacterium]
MKKIIFILTLTLFSGFASQAQDDHNDKIRDKMREFIQKRLNLSRNEAERFSPVFVRYFTEWRHALRENKDNLIREQKVVELKIRYRNEFREIVGEKRSSEVYKQQDVFIDQLKRMREEQIKNRRDDRPNKRFEALNY